MPTRRRTAGTIGVLATVAAACFLPAREASQAVLE